ncbi:glycosyltransferase involved in cell wall biosynthesis/O-antigen/teichoic acid export membrane protein [Mycobacterium sp. OAS707]|uniref:glycosyltransferase n=1 Tax=Mycobacterium sp. OAS707 TaxID=2663822 RepID=UPI001A099009|nr:glycosyltransferase involved in cell wall biosynthesis/O-antigen/teichoic acid export membrane protein [Mycobacterium sp. OAS707]
MASRSGGSAVQSLRVGAIAQVLPLIAGYGLNLIATPYVVSRLGLHDFGVWAMTGAIAQYAALFDLGASRAVNRYVALFHARGDAAADRAVVGICVSAALTLGAGFGVLAALLPGPLETILHTGDPALTRSLLLCSVAILTCGLTARVLAGASFGRGRQVPANIGLAVLGITQVTGGVVALTFTAGLRSYALGTVAGAAVGLCAVLGAIVLDEGRITIGRPRMAMAREIIGFGLKSQALGAADVVLFQSGKLIAGIVIGPAAAGAYELGIRLVQGVQAFGSAASVAITTHLTRAFAVGGIDEIRRQYSRLTSRNAAAAIFLPFLLGTTASSAIPLWLGERQGAVVGVATALVFGIAVNVSTGVCSATMFAIGRSGTIGATAITSAAGCVALAIPMAIGFGFKGLVAAYATWFVIGNVLGVWFLQSRVDISMRTYLRAVSGPFGVALVASAAAAPINFIAVPHDRVSAVVPFIASAAVFCAIYICLASWLGYLPRFKSRARPPLGPIEPEEPLSATTGRVTMGRTNRIGSVAIIGTRGYPSFYGGFETLVRKLAPFLADRGWDVTVYSRPGATVDRPEFAHPGITSVTTKGVDSKSLSTLSFGATSTFDAARRKPDVALVMNVANGYWLPMLRSRGIPSVLNVDGIEWQRDKWSRLGKAVFKGGAKMTARFADTLICDSVEIGRFWHDNFQRDGIFIPYGGDQPSGQQEVLAGLEKRNYVLLVARLVPENSIGEFLDAAESVVDEFPVVVVGSSGSGGPLEDRIRCLTEKHNQFVWLGHLSNDKLLSSLWQNCGAYFHGHSVGGTNPALVQAMASGAPTIARDTVFNREVLQDSGLFVPPDPREIAAATRLLMSSPSLQNSLCAKAKERACETFSWDAICDAYEDALLAATDRQVVPRPVRRGRRRATSFAHAAPSYAG